MRKILWIFSLFFVCITGCENNRTERHLSDIESYIMEYPDSALAVLETMNRNLLTTDRLKAHHALLHAMALDKNFVDVSDDSLASIAVSFYSKKGPEMYEARSLYYLGLSYYYAQDYNAAILEFTKAENVAQRSDSLYWGFVKVAQADTYTKTHSYREAINCLSLASEIYHNIDADYYFSLSELRIAQTLLNLECFEQGEAVLLKLMQQEGLNELLELSVKASYAFVCASQKGDYSSAVRLYDEVFKRNNIVMSVNDYWAYVFALNSLGRKDDAGNLMEQLNDIDSSGITNYWMYMIKKSDGDYREALKYLEKSTTEIDKEVTKALQQSLSLSQRDYYESEYQNAEYKARNRKLMAISVAASSLLVLLIVLWGTAVYVRRQREEKEYYLNYADEVRRQLEASKNENYPELKRKYLEICKSKFELIGSLYEEYILYHGKKNAEHSVYAKVSEIINDFINDDAYKSQLESVIDESLDGIMSKLRTEMPRFKEVDYSIFSFMIIGFDVTTISHLLNISMNVVYIRKSRMKHRIEEASPESKERFLELLT